MLCCGYTLTDFPISIRLTSLALWQSNDCPSASKATLMNMDKYFMWIHYERLHNHNKAKHNKTVCIFLGIYCMPLYVNSTDDVSSYHAHVHNQLRQHCHRVFIGHVLFVHVTVLISKHFYPRPPLAPMGIVVVPCVHPPFYIHPPSVCSNRGERCHRSYSGFRLLARNLEG